MSGYRRGAFPGGGKAHICSETNIAFLGKVLTEIGMMDKSLLINVTSQTMFFRLVEKRWKRYLTCQMLKDGSGGLKVMHPKNKH